MAELKLRDTKRAFISTSVSCPEHGLVDRPWVRATEVIGIVSDERLIEEAVKVVRDVRDNHCRRCGQQCEVT